MLEYGIFWQKALGVKGESLLSGFTRSSSGLYVERHQKKYVFLFTDLTTYARVLAGHPHRLEKLGDQSPEQGLRIKFDDLDYGFEKEVSFRPGTTPPVGVTVQKLTIKDKRTLSGFRKKCSSKDWDTLDLNLGKDYALGLFLDHDLLGVARFAKMKAAPRLVDITVIVLRKARGKGYSTVLVSKLIEAILSKRLIPKYRVAEKNVQSRAVAKRLGLVPLFSLKTFR